MMERLEQQEHKVLQVTMEPLEQQDRKAQQEMTE
jgi:hypothetical protein